MFAWSEHGDGVHRLVAHGHDTPRVVLVHRWTLHFLTFASHRVCEASAVVVAVHFEVGVCKRDIFIVYGWHDDTCVAADDRWW